MKGPRASKVHRFQTDDMPDLFSMCTYKHLVLTHVLVALEDDTAGNK